MSNMFKLPKIVRFVLVVIVVGCAAPVSEAGFVVWLTIVHSSGPRTGHTFQPDDLPQVVTVDVCMGDEGLLGYWMDIDCANLSNGLGGDLRLAEVSCGVDEDCEAALGVPGSSCIDGKCEAIFLDTSRANYVFSPPTCQINGEFTDSSCGPSMGVGGTSAVACYRGGCSYVGNFALEIPADAVGSFEIEVSDESTLTTQNFQTGQIYTFPMNEIDPFLRFYTTIRIAARVPPAPVANSDPQAAPAARSSGVEFTPQTPVVDPFAVRVTLDSLHHPDPPYASGAVADFSAFEGQHRWLGPPVQYVEASANPTTFWASTLQCTPHYMDWSTIGPIHIVGSEVVPSSTLSVRTFGMNCMNSEATCTNVSAPLEISTARWGDVQIPFSTPGGPTQPDLGDAAALVDKFKNQPAALSKARTKIQPDIPNLAGDVDFSDISMCVDAFKGRPYPFTMQSCP